MLPSLFPSLITRTEPEHLPPHAGAFVKDIYGWGQLSAPVIAGPFFVLWPELSIAVGICQVIRARNASAPEKVARKATPTARVIPHVIFFWLFFAARMVHDAGCPHSARW